MAKFMFLLSPPYNIVSLIYQNTTVCSNLTLKYVKDAVLSCYPSNKACRVKFLQSTKNPGDKLHWQHIKIVSQEITGLNLSLVFHFLHFWLCMDFCILCVRRFYTAHPDCRREQITWYVSISATTMAAIHLFLWMCESCLRHALSCKNLLRTEETKEQTWVTGTEVARASQTLPIATPWSRWSLLCSGTGKLF